MAILIKIWRDDAMRFVANFDDWPGCQIAGTIAEVDEHNMAGLVLYLASSYGERHVQFSILIEISKGNLAL